METNALIESNLSLAERMAKSRSKSVDPRIYYDELKSAAYAGLVDAAHKHHDPVPFEVYARTRISGEMEDYIRELNWNRYHPVQMRPLEDCYVAVEENTPHRMVSRLVEAAFMVLPDEGRKLFHWYYREGLTMKQIGENIGVGESHVSKLIKKYHTYLRNRQQEILAIAER